MKLIRLLMVVAFLGIVASVAFADGVPTDPTLLTSGCGRLGQPKCDAYLITSPDVALTITLTLDHNSADLLSGDLVASLINVSGETLTKDLTVTFVVPAGLSFQGCGTPPEGVTLLYACDGGGSSDSPITSGTAVFHLSGASICSVDVEDDVVPSESAGGFAYQSDGDSDDDCQAAFSIALKPVFGETLPETLSGTISSIPAPEPSSAVLLLFGLAGGLLALKSLRTNLA